MLLFAMLPVLLLLLQCCSIHCSSRPLTVGLLLLLMPLLTSQLLPRSLGWPHSVHLSCGSHVVCAFGAAPSNPALSATVELPNPSCRPLSDRTLILCSPDGSWPNQAERHTAAPHVFLAVSVGLLGWYRLHRPEYELGMLLCLGVAGNVHIEKRTRRTANSHGRQAQLRTLKPPQRQGGVTVTPGAAPRPRLRYPRSRLRGAFHGSTAPSKKKY